MAENNDILLRIEHLEQYFKNGRYLVKAVDDVSFDIKKGEVLGLVGESGCGKTTTGRSIIKLYDITSGSIYFEGQRIAAGTRHYKQVIKDAKKEYLDKKNQLTAEYAEKIKSAEESAKEGLKKELAQALAPHTAEFAEICRTYRDKIARAKSDHNDCNKRYAASLIAQTEAEYAPKIKEIEEKLAALSPDSEERSTLLLQQKALLKERAGKIAFDKKARIMNKMQMIFQDPIASLNPRMTVREIIAEGLVIRGYKDKAEIDEKVFKVLELVGLVPEHADRYPHEFSGGQRQRIGIARAVILEPELIIADEPVSALDVSIQAQVINLLNELRGRLGLTILFIAHDLSVVKYFSDRIAVMYFGKIVELAGADELFKNPMHPYTKSLLSAIPLPDPRTEKQRKRIIYNPIAEHDYSVDKPVMRQLKDGHFIYCNDAEFAKYQSLVKG